MRIVTILIILLSTGLAFGGDIEYHHPKPDPAWTFTDSDDIAVTGAADTADGIMSYGCMATYTDDYFQGCVGDEKCCDDARQNFEREQLDYYEYKIDSGTTYYRKADCLGCAWEDVMPAWMVQKLMCNE